MPRPEPVRPDPQIPQAVDVAIIGGGIVGVSAAWKLAEMGVRVALFEKGEIAGEQSSRNWGYCRQQGRDPRELPLAMMSLALWRRLDHEVAGETGFREAGILYVSDDKATIAGWEDWLGHARAHGIETQLLTHREIANLLPQCARRWRAGLWTPSDGRAEPEKAAPAIARAAQRLGATLHTRTAVRGLDLAAGRIAGIVSERGAVRAQAVVLAGGASSQAFCRRHGIVLKALNVRASVLRTGPLPEVFAGGLAAPDFAIRRRLDGGYSLAAPGATTFDIVPEVLRWLADFWPAYKKEQGRMKVRLGRAFIDALVAPTHWSLDKPSPFEDEDNRVLDPRPDHGALAEAVAAFRAAFPALGEVRIVERWAGMIDATPDAIPVISEVETLPGLYLATGFSGHGFGIGPGAGRLVAELVSGRAPSVDPTPFRFARQHNARQHNARRHNARQHTAHHHNGSGGRPSGHSKHPGRLEDAPRPSPKNPDKKEPRIRRRPASDKRFLIAWPFCRRDWR